MVRRRLSVPLELTGGSVVHSKEIRPDSSEGRENSSTWPPYNENCEKLDKKKRQGAEQESRKTTENVTDGKPQIGNERTGELELLQCKNSDDERTELRQL